MGLVGVVFVVDEAVDQGGFADAALPDPEDFGFVEGEDFAAAELAQVCQIGKLGNGVWDLSNLIVTEVKLRQIRQVPDRVWEYANLIVTKETGFFSMSLAVTNYSGKNPVSEVLDWDSRRIRQIN